MTSIQCRTRHCAEKSTMKYLYRNPTQPATLRLPLGNSVDKEQRTCQHHTCPRYRKKQAAPHVVHQELHAAVSATTDGNHTSSRAPSHLNSWRAPHFLLTGEKCSRETADEDQGEYRERHHGTGMSAICSATKAVEFCFGRKTMKTSAA